jgi:hypothetical protein
MTSRADLVKAALLIFSLFGCVGCMSQWTVSPTTGTSDGTADLTTLGAMLATAEYRGGGFVQMDPQPFESTLAPGSFVTMFVSNAAAAAYETVTPTGTTGGADFPEGGVVVREVSDASGNVTLLTTLMKCKSGYNPISGDFMFAVTNTAGQPVDDGGVTQWGPLAVCSSCHAGRASSGYLFGVSQSVRAALVNHPGPTTL